MAALPLPVATSSTRQPACRSAVSQSCSATSTIREATTAKSPLDHATCWRFLIASKSGGAASVTLMSVVSWVRGPPAGVVRAPSKVRRPSLRDIGSAYPSWRRPVYLVAQCGPAPSPYRSGVRQTRAAIRAAADGRRRRRREDRSTPTARPRRHPMKAAVVHSFDEPLEIEDVPVPEPGPDQVLVRIESSGLCHTDIHAARGEWPIKPSPPFIPGHEGVGVIERLGSGNAHGLEVGDRVALP